MNGHEMYLKSELEKMLDSHGLLETFKRLLIEDGEYENISDLCANNNEDSWIIQAFVWPEDSSLWVSINSCWQKFLDSRPLQQKVTYEEACSSNVVALDNIHNDISEIRFRLSAIKKKLDEIEGWLGV